MERGGGVCGGVCGGFGDHNHGSGLVGVGCFGERLKMKRPPRSPHLGNAPWRPVMARIALGRVVRAGGWIIQAKEFSLWAAGASDTSYPKTSLAILITSSSAAGTSCDIPSLMVAVPAKWLPSSQ